MRTSKKKSLFRLWLSLAISLCSISCATHQIRSSPDQASVASETEVKNAEETKPVPALGKETWISNDGQSFPFTRWGASSKPKTVIVAVHGLSGAASDFKPLGEFFTKRSTAVYSYALRGQGNDPREDEIGDIKDPSLWYSDLDTFITLVRAKNPLARLFLYGESLGGLISVHGMETLAEENRKAIRGLILSSPVVSLKDRDKASKVKYAVLKSAITLMPLRKISLEKLAGDKADMNITGDTDHRENIRGTPHAVDKFSFRLLGTLEKMIDGCEEQAASIEKPILVLYPAHDLLTTADDVESWFEALQAKDKEKYLFSKSYHMLLHDKERADVLEKVRDWLDRH